MTFRIEGIKHAGQEWRAAGAIVTFGHQIEAIRPGKSAPTGQLPARHTTRTARNRITGLAREPAWEPFVRSTLPRAPEDSSMRWPNPCGCPRAFQDLPKGDVDAAIAELIRRLNG